MNQQGLIFYGLPTDCNYELCIDLGDKTECTWSCLEIRMQDEVTVWRLIIVPLKGWKSSNIWEQC